MCECIPCPEGTALHFLAPHSERSPGKKRAAAARRCDLLWEVTESGGRSWRNIHNILVIHRGESLQMWVSQCMYWLNQCHRDLLRPILGRRQEIKPWTGQCPVSLISAHFKQVRGRKSIMDKGRTCEKGRPCQLLYSYFNVIYILGTLDVHLCKTYITNVPQAYPPWSSESKVSQSDVFIAR